MAKVEKPRFLCYLTSMSNVHYDAFISYRHAQLDSEVATSLHRKLERFKLPANLRKKFPKEKWRIRRVFRDQDELPLADNLSDPIEEAIKNSDYLIVICTPRLPQSKWCLREIELFKQLHGQDKILAILAEGEPEDSFPEAICYRDEVRLNENGEEVIERVDVEPLAADVRSESKSKRNKMLDDAVLRMTAPMYHLGYDDLKQRHREQKIRRIVTIMAIVAAFFFAFGMVCMALMMRINEQKQVISEQKQELEKEYAESKMRYAESMSVVSETLLKEGRQKDALYALRSVMPDEYGLGGYDPPYLVSTHYALQKALGTYEMGVFFPCESIAPPTEEEMDAFWGDPGNYRDLSNYLADKQVMSAGKMDDGRVLIVTSSCELYIYDEEQGLLLDYTSTGFTDPPGEYVHAAAYRDDTLYLQFSDADYVAVYRFLRPDPNTHVGTITYDERYAVVKNLLFDGDELWSDDGTYCVRPAANHTVEIYHKNNTDVPIRTLYGMTGSVCGFEKLEGTDDYLLVGSGKYSYLLNEFCEIIGRIPYYYDYLPDEKAFLQYDYGNAKNTYDVYSTPLMEYEDLIAEADSQLQGYEPSDAVSERYRMLGDNLSVPER